MKSVALLLLAAFMLCAEKGDSPTGPRITPPTIRVVTPRGVSRGATVEMTIDGFNLAKASHIFFSEPGVKGRILRVKELPDLPDVRLGSNGGVSTVDLGPLPPRNQVTVEVEVDAEANVGEVQFRLQTPLGTTPEGSFLIEPYYGESPDKEPNDSIDTAFEAYLPTILTGAISKPGDVDHFKIQVEDGTQLVFENGAMALGSTLQPLVSVLNANGDVLAEYGYHGGRSVTRFAHTFAKGGTYYLRVEDYEKSGKPTHFYRIMVGEFPLVTSTWPMGLRRGQEAAIHLAGYHLDKNGLAVKGEPSGGSEDSALLRPFAAFNTIALDIGEEPELQSGGKNTTIAAAQAVSVPVTINGHVPAAGRQFYRFHAGKGQALALEVKARRLGSELDSLVEVLDASGHPVEQAIVRPVVETTTTLRDHDSAQPGVRIQQWNGISAGDWMMLGREIVRVEALPRTPDEDIRYEQFGGQRLAFFNTSPEAHAIDQTIYKVEMLPAGTRISSIGLPITHLYFQNDDGGPGYGKDSYLSFTAPADGDYIASVRDVQGLGGDDYGYRLTIREPRPDFRLTVNPQNPNVPRGGTIPVTVTALRLDGLDQAIEVALGNLPAGFHATKGTILPGQNNTVLLLSAAQDASIPEAAPMRIKGSAAGIIRYASPEDKLKLIALAPLSDVVMTSHTKVVELLPGQTADIKVSIARNNGFAGRVPVQVMNLPPLVKLPSFGLNGVLLNEDETERTFQIEAAPQAAPVEQLVYLGGLVETRSGQQNIFAAPEPVLVRIKPPAKPIQ